MLCTIYDLRRRTNEEVRELHHSTQWRGSPGNLHFVTTSKVDGVYHVLGSREYFPLRVVVCCGGFPIAAVFPGLWVHARSNAPVMSKKIVTAYVVWVPSMSTFSARIASSVLLPNCQGLMFMNATFSSDLFIKASNIFPRTGRRLIGL